MHLDSSCRVFLIFRLLSLQEELEMRQKTELVSQIRAMESVPIIRANSMDLTETSGKGLLSEMSVAEVLKLVCKL